MQREYQVCSRCVMDTSDPMILFDETGVCNHCREFDEITCKSWYRGQEGAKRWQIILKNIKEQGHGQEYDCIMGLSGGVDSSYMALKAYQWGLRPLVVHVDAGWNSELAVANIEKIVRYCKYDLHTHVVDWDEMRDLQVAYLKAAVANQDVPQDHAFFAALYHFAMANKIRYVLSGGNTATESIFPDTWHHSAMDLINMRAIQKKHGRYKLKTFPQVNLFDYYISFPFLKKMKVVRPLNYMDYNKQVAIAELEKTIGWRSYGRKHGESLFTKFFQNYYLPVKFGYDKRRPHLSSLIVSGQMTRQEAMANLEEPLYDPRELDRDIQYFCSKLQISHAEFEELMATPPRLYNEYPSWDFYYHIIKQVQAIVEKILHRSVRAYS